MLRLLTLISVISVGLSVSDASADSRLKCDFRAYEKALKAAESSGPALLPDAAGSVTPIPLDMVRVIDKEIRRKVMVEDVFARRTPAGSVEVSARIVNCTDYPIQVLGRTSFMDGIKRPTEKVSAWQLVFVEPRSFANYSEVSIGLGQVEHYLIEVRGNR